MVVEVSSASTAIGIPSGVSSRALVGLSMFSAIATATTRKPAAMEARAAHGGALMFSQHASVTGAIASSIRLVRTARSTMNPSLRYATINVIVVKAIMLVYPATSLSLSSSL